jgi:hypothetical protein
VVHIAAHNLSCVIDSFCYMFFLLVYKPFFIIVIVAISCHGPSCSKWQCYVIYHIASHDNESTLDYVVDKNGIISGTRKLLHNLP